MLALDNPKVWIRNTCGKLEHWVEAWEKKQQFSQKNGNKEISKDKSKLSEFGCG